MTDSVEFLPSHQEKTTPGDTVGVWDGHLKFWRIPYRDPWCWNIYLLIGIIWKITLGVNVGVHIPAPWILWDWFDLWFFFELRSSIELSRWVDCGLSEHGNILKAGWISEPAFLGYHLRHPKLYPKSSHTVFISLPWSLPFSSDFYPTVWSDLLFFVYSKIFASNFMVFYPILLVRVRIGPRCRTASFTHNMSVVFT